MSQILMYENGNAIGGEGTPTNASGITFNNTGTDLVSENVENAIKEVNAKFDRGSVTVTANGINTYSTMFNLLFGYADKSKMSGNSYLTIDNHQIYQVTYISDTVCQFSRAEVSSNSNRIQFVILQASNSKYREVVGTNFTDLSSTVAPNGEEYTIHY